MIKTNSIGVVLCRLVSILLAVQVMNTVAAAVSNAYIWSSIATTVTYFALAGATPLVAAIILWVYAEKISRINVPDNSTDYVVASSPSELLVVGVTLIGLYLFVFGIIGAAQYEAITIGKIFVDDDARQTFDDIGLVSWSARVNYTTRVILGIGLILGRDRIGRQLRNLRYAGRNAS